MAHSLDPEMAAPLSALNAAFGDVALPERGDWQGCRAMSNAFLAAVGSTKARVGGVTVTRHGAVAPDGAPVELRWYSRDGEAPGSAAVYLHGGGMVGGSLDLYEPFVRSYVAASGVPMLGVDYRLAPEHPHPVPVEDAYAGLRWLSGHAQEMGVEPSRIAVMGDSAGGGIAAGVALLARSRGLPLARQILIYPMLDDRNTVPDPALAPFVTWSHDENYTGWSALLGQRTGAEAVPAVAAPSRATDLGGVAPAYLEAAELDILRDEGIEYARRLARAGVPVELHVHPGVPHGFDLIAPEADVTKRAFADRIRVLRAL